MENRRSPRKPLRYPAEIEIGEGAEPRACILADASENGARLTIDSPQDVPQEFMLLLSRDGRSKRKCHVVWRSESQIGIEYRQDPPAEPEPSLAMRLKAKR